MSFIRTKEIPPGSGNLYSYRQESYREGGKVKTRYLEYLGKAGSGGTGSLGITTRQGFSSGGRGSALHKDTPSIVLGTTKEAEKNTSLTPLTNSSDSAIVNTSKGEEKKMTEAELKQKERAYNNSMNEGGEGYNPYTDKIRDNECKNAASVVSSGLTSRQQVTAEREARERTEVARYAEINDKPGQSDQRQKLIDKRNKLYHSMSYMDNNFQEEAKELENLNEQIRKMI